jgi:hypothetical protein
MGSSRFGKAFILPFVVIVTKKWCVFGGLRWRCHVVLDIQQLTNNKGSKRQNLVNIACNRSSYAMIELLPSTTNCTSSSWTTTCQQIRSTVLHQLHRGAGAWGAKHRSGTGTAQHHSDPSGRKTLVHKEEHHVLARELCLQCIPNISADASVEARTRSLSSLMHERGGADRP